MATYEQIVSRIKLYTQDNAPPLAAVIDPLIDDIILRAEQRISKDLHIDAMLATSRPAALLPAGTFWVPKPDDWVANNQMCIVPQPAGTTIYLAFRARSFVDRVYPVLTERGVPRFYCNYDQATWRIAPALVADSSAEIIYDARISGLSPAMPTTWMSVNHPDLLFKAVLAECEIFHKMPANKEMYETSYAAELERTSAEVTRQRTDAANLQRAKI